MTIDRLRVYLDRLREKRLSEDESLVCLERARILQETRECYGGLSRTERQAAVLCDLCAQITPVIEPEDLLAGRMPEVVPTAEEEAWIAEHPQLFSEPGLPGWLDSLSIYVPDWDRLLQVGVGGIAAHARQSMDAIPPDAGDRAERTEFLAAAIEAVDALSHLIRRYAAEARRMASVEADAARRGELEQIAGRCERVAWEPPSTFLEALQLLQLTHMALACLVGGRDVTPGRLDQYLLPFYRRDIEAGVLDPETAALLLAMFFLRLTQMAGNDTDWDDNRRRSPCRYTHLYVTVGGVDGEGRSAVNPFSFVVLEAVRVLRYKEPTLLVRWQEGMERDSLAGVARLVRERAPVTIYHDEVVIRALESQGVPLRHARGYAHSACHNVLVVGQEAGSGPVFHNLPLFLLRVLRSGQEPASFEDLLAALRAEVRSALAGARRAWEKAWAEQYGPSCPLLASSLMPICLEQGRPCWQAATVSHFNHHLMGLATLVDSLLALRTLVFEEGRLSLAELASVLESDWEGHEALRTEVRTRLPRYGQGDHEARALTEALGRMWVEEVESASRGMARLQMWPGFYSHVSHVHQGARVPATPDGRRSGEALSENLAPSYGTPRCSPTSILGDMALLPFDHTPSGAATLALPAVDLEGVGGMERLVALVEGYFAMGGLHLQINVLDDRHLEDAMEHPERYADLTVRVTGYSAYFTRLSRSVQEDLVRRCRRDGVTPPAPRPQEGKRHP